MSGRLTREAAGLRPAATVRLVHLGLGNFFRAHQAWYTDLADDAAAWGIAAFAGRSAGLATTLTAQQGAYTLLTRSLTGTAARQVASISSAHPADDHARWLDLLAAPGTSAVTLTVTEAAYCRAGGGEIDLDDPVLAADLPVLRSAPAAPVHSVPARLLAGLRARRDRGGGPLALVPCDNLSGNGRVLAGVLAALAEQVDPGLAGWIADQVSFVDTMVDRITPSATSRDAAEAADLTGVRDEAVVVSEEFSEWVLAGAFPAGRPDWESAGARFVDDVAPYERRKLALLNGAHSLIAYTGALRGHDTVAEAIGDRGIAGWVEEWWDEASMHLGPESGDVAGYRAALLDRFANPYLHHRLAQIAADGSTKLRERVVPTLRSERAAGRTPRAATRVLAAWTLHLLGHGNVAIRDEWATELRADLAGADLVTAATAVLDLLVPDLRDDPLVAAVAARAGELTG